MELGVTIDEILKHHGVRGMKWGSRKAKASSTSSAPSSHDATKASEYQARAKAGGTKTLSNPELQHLVNRMNLEQNYSRLATKPSVAQKGAKFAKDMLISVGKQQATMLATAAVAKQVAGVLKK